MDGNFGKVKKEIRRHLQLQKTETLCLMLAAAQDGQMAWADDRTCLVGRSEGGFLVARRAHQVSRAYLQLGYENLPEQADYVFGDGVRHRRIILMIKAELRRREMNGLVNSTVECGSEKPVDTVQFRDQAPVYSVQ